MAYRDPHQRNFDDAAQLVSNRNEASFVIAFDRRSLTLPLSRNIRPVWSSYNIVR